MRLRSLTGVLVTPVLLTALLAPSVLPARADDSLGVARLSWMQGSVAVQHTDGGPNVAGAVNAPLVTGDAMTTGSHARAEIQFDGTSALRLLDNTQVRFARLDPPNRNVQLAEGTVNLDLFHNANTQPVIDTPSVSMRAVTDGRYRVTVTNAGVSYITARSGQADVLLPQGQQELSPGSTMVVSGRASNPSVSYVREIGYDNFDQYNQERDNALYAQAGVGGISNAVAVGDLNGYGNWVNDPTYGNVWVPYQSAGWAPYRQGYWSWLPGYGWTWVSSEPWGWAPYHYGRWFYNSGDGGWGWYPSQVDSWLPALVAFFLFGTGGFGNSGYGGFGNYGSIGWCPLAPGENYYPRYGNGFGFGGYGYGYGQPSNIINITNITNIYNYYANAANGGVTGISARRFTMGDFRKASAVPPSQLHTIGSVRGPLPIKPGAPNRRFAADSVLPPALANRRFAQGVAYHPHFAAPARVATPAVPPAQVRGFGHQPPALATHASGATFAKPATHGLTTTSALPKTGALPAAHATEMQRAVTPTSPSREVMPPSHSFAAPVEHSTVATPQANAWSRFNEGRGTTTYARPSAGLGATPRDSVRSTTNLVPHANGTSGASADATKDAPRTNRAPVNDAWSRFTSQRGGYAQPLNRASYDTRTNVPATQSNPDTHTAVPYAQRTYTPSSPQGAQPRSYAQPQYSQPRSYPQPQYTQPRSYAQPQYSQPRSYAQPAAPRSYSAPRAASAPPPSSGGGSRGNNGSQKDHHPPQ